MGRIYKAIDFHLIEEENLNIPNIRRWFDCFEE
jgi:hypothetical protein